MAIPPVRMSARVLLLPLVLLAAACSSTSATSSSAPTGAPSGSIASVGQEGAEPARANGSATTTPPSPAAPFGSPVFPGPRISEGLRMGPVLGLASGEGDSLLIMTGYSPDGTVGEVFNMPASGTLDTQGSQSNLGILCGTRPVVRDGVRQSVAFRLRTTPAQGVEPATYDLDLLVLDGRLKPIRTVSLAKAGKGEAKCLTGEWAKGGKVSVGEGGAWTMYGPSADGQWVVVTDGRQETKESRSFFVDLNSGKLTTLLGVPERVEGNGVHQECASETDSDIKDECVATPGNPRGIMIHSGSDQSESGTGSCAFGDFSCKGFETGAPDGSIVVKRTGGIEVVDSATGRKKHNIPQMDDVNGAAYLEGKRVLLVSGAGGAVATGETGNVLWKLPSGRVCGTTPQGFVMTANEQIALVDAAGKQLAFAPWEGDCPQMLGSYGVLKNSSWDPEWKVFSLFSR